MEKTGWSAQPLFMLSTKQKIGSSLTLNQTAKVIIPNLIP
jgi:hypothetical protein